jgi:predicted DNA-binding transcriptional regulator YafY
LLDQVLFEITGEDLEDGDAGGGGGGGFAAGNDAEQSSPVDRSRRALSRRFVLARPPQAVPGEVRQAFDRVLRGLVERRALDLRYHPRSGPPRDYVLRPYTLVLGEHELAVTGAVGAVPADGRPLSGDAIRTFALHRIREIKVRAERFTLPNLSAWDPEARYEGSWGLMVGEPEDVWVAIHPAFADLVAARSWHPSQIRAAAAADDWIRLQFRVFTGGEFRSWLLGWGPWLRVEEPAALRDWVDRMRTMRTAEGEPGPEEVFRIP